MRPPIDIVHLFPQLNSKLVSFLRSLSAADWEKPTVARKWVVKDVAAHLLDGNYRQISMRRDGWLVPPDRKIHSNEDLVQYLNQLNADWVKAAKRLSYPLITEQLELTNEMVYRLFAHLDLFAPSVYPVSWAGETISYNWFDLAREYTERWLHQQQIRDAFDDREIMTKELYYPFLHIFMQAWPFTCAHTPAKEGTALKTVITGEGGGEWFLVRKNGEWKLSAIAANRIAAETVIDGDAAWKLFSKSVRKEDITGSFEIKGDHQLGDPVLNMVSVMA
jgi:hypothetical protein